MIFDPRVKVITFYDEGSNKDMILYPTGETLHGALNHNYVFSDQEGNLYVCRKPRENAGILAQIRDEFVQSGFLSRNGNYRFRNIKEQVEFMHLLYRSHLKTILPVYACNSWILLPFVEGESFKDHLIKGNFNAMTIIIDNFIAAHKKGIVYGDRWPSNTIVKPDGDIVEVDFDIEITGHNAKEFEIAQFFFHMLLFARRRNKLLQYLMNYLQSCNNIKIYDLSIVSAFLLNYVQYSRKRQYEGVPEESKQKVAGYITRAVTAFSRL